MNTKENLEAITKQFFYQIAIFQHEYPSTNTTFYSPSLTDVCKNFEHNLVFEAPSF